MNWCTAKPRPASWLVKLLALAVMVGVFLLAAGADSLVNWIK